MLVQSVRHVGEFFSLHVYAGLCFPDMLPGDIFVGNALI